MVDLVIARHEEDVSWLNLNLINVERIFLYNKGVSSPQVDLPNAKLEPLENKGRESDTILHHIVNHYHDLSDITIFAQGHPFDHCPTFLNVFKPPMSLESIGESLDRFYRRNNFYSRWVDLEYVPLGQLWEQQLHHLNDWDKYLWLNPMFKIFEVFFGRQALPKMVWSSWGGQFATTRKTIHKFSLDQYKMIKEISDNAHYLPWGFEKYWLYMYTKTQEDFDRDSLLYPVI